MFKSFKGDASYGSKVVKSIMLLSKVTSVPLLSFLLLASIAILGLDMPSQVNSYATSNNNNNENASFPISSATPDGKEHRRTRDITDANQSSSSQSSFIPPSNADSNNASRLRTLLVTKEVINEGGGEAEPSDFTITVDGNNPTPSSFDGSSSGTSVQLLEGRFNTTGTVSVINSTTNTVVANIPVGRNPQAIVYNPANGLVYTANTLSNTLSIINGTSNSLVGSIIVGAFPGKNPAGITINPINNTLYVTNMGSNTVSVINGTTNVVVDD